MIIRDTSEKTYLSRLAAADIGRAIVTLQSHMASMGADERVMILRGVTDGYCTKCGERLEPFGCNCPSKEVTP